MTIPILTAMQPDTARSPASAPGNSHSQTDSHRRDESDFAAAMSDGAQDTRSEPARPEHAAGEQGRAESARKSDADGTGRESDRQNGRDGASAEETAALVQDASRRQVTIPELPGNRNEAAAPDQQAAGAISADQPAAANPEIAPGAARYATAQSASGQPAADETATLRPASGQAGRADATSAIGTLAHSDASKASFDTEKLATQKTQANGETARDDQRRAAAQPDARLAATGNPVAEALRADKMARAAVQPPEDRIAARARDPMARAMDAVAATPAPTPQTNAAQAAVSAQSAMLQLAARDTAAAKDKTEPLLSPDGDTDGLRIDTRGTLGSTSTQQGSFASAINQTQLPRGIAMQLGDFVRAMPNRPVEVALSPEELGRVRLSISTSEGGVMLHVLAERPETLDLMRRHADQLARELANLGFGAIDLAFGQGRDPDSGDGDETSGDAKARNARSGDSADTAVPVTGPVNRMVLSPSGGLDIRI